MQNFGHGIKVYLNTLSVFKYTFIALLLINQITFSDSTSNDTFSLNVCRSHILEKYLRFTGIKLDDAPFKKYHATNNTYGESSKTCKIEQVLPHKCKMIFNLPSSTVLLSATRDSFVGSESSCKSTACVELELSNASKSMGIFFFFFFFFNVGSNTWNVRIIDGTGLDGVYATRFHSHSKCFNRTATKQWQLRNNYSLLHLLPWSCL